MAKGIMVALGLTPKGKGSPSPPDAEEADESAPDAESGSKEADEYKSLIADAAKNGDWDSFADAVAGLVQCSK